MYRSILKYVSRNPGARGVYKLFHGFESDDLRQEVMDLPFRSPVGMAPGFDPAAEYYNAAGASGCGFTVLGPLSFTREGGVRAAVKALRNSPPKGGMLIGLCISKAESSSSEDSIARDFLDAFDYSYDFSDFTVADFSNSAMGPVHDSAFIKAITDPLLEARLAYDIYHPVVLRLSAGLKNEELFPILDYCLMNGIDAVMLPGEEALKAVAEFSKGRLPVISEVSTGTPAKAAALLEAGASLLALQCSSARFKPGLPKAIMKTIRKK